MYCGKELLENVELFNAGELEDYHGGFILRRYPDRLSRFLSSEGADMSKQSTGCEIRFVKTERGKIRVNISTENEGTYILLYRGDRLEAGYSVDKRRSIVINDNPCDKIKNPDFFSRDSFSKDVIRLVLQGDYVSLDSIETYGRKIRRPRPDEVPQKTILAYGSSITHGARSGNTQLTYASFAGQLLGAQVLNKGLAGSCLCENEVADYFAENIKYDMFVFEHGTNMYAYGMSENYGIDGTVKFIRERGEYMLSRMLEKNPDKPIFLIMPLRPETAYEKPSDYEAIARAVSEMHKNAASDKCILITAEELESKTSVVTADLIHPSPEGHAVMGFNLAEIIKKHI